MASTDEITFTLTKTEALALSKVADLGLRAAEAFNLIQNTATAERALVKLHGALAAKPAKGK